MVSQSDSSMRPAAPVRTCIGCRQRATKRELLRVTLGEDDHGPVVVPDPRGTAPGRGAHLHPDPACVALAERRRAFRRALRVEGGDEIGLAVLRAHVDAHVSEK